MGLVIHITLSLSLLLSSPEPAVQPASKAKPISQSLRMAPSFFVPNARHQKTGKPMVSDDTVLAFVQTFQGRVMFTPSGAYIGMTSAPQKVPGDKNDPAQTVVLKAGFSAAQAQKRNLVPRLEKPTAGKVNYLIGARDEWQTQIPTYEKLVYDQVWPGIDLEYLGYMDHLEFRLQSSGQ
ncbi:MAG: hypothetical protein H6510_02125 [Acidobacteria bacterium]|nr:hypothetical protein [Acidobacteriota bacterium]MCB9396590.1 hypothetical protein [Acidobacteriota bacterium]